MHEEFEKPTIIKSPIELVYTPINFLGNEFYKGTRNKLTEEKLKELSSFSEKIIEPKIYGTYADENHYLQTLNLVLASTEETRHRGMFFLRTVLPLLQSKNTLLDVGPGCGTLTQWIGSYFKEITVVDNNEKIIKNLNRSKKIVRRNTHLVKMQGSILEVDLPFDHYDLGMISHVLYYIEKKHWLKAVQRVYNSVKIGGMIVIALSGEKLGKADLIKHFGGELLDINFLAKECFEQFGEAHTKVFASDEAFYALDIITILHIAGFFLCDASVTSPKNELLDYVMTHCLAKNDRFELSTQQKFILIKKG